MGPVQTGLLFEDSAVPPSFAGSARRSWFMGGVHTVASRRL
jgi:hypothetical protein